MSTGLRVAAGARMIEKRGQTTEIVDISTGDLGWGIPLVRAACSAWAACHPGSGSP
jgi:hypothetical protein